MLDTWTELHAKVNVCCCVFI